MATQDVFSAEELARLRGFPEINSAELIRYFTLTGADEAFVRQFHTGRNVLGVAVQLCTLPWLGFVPDEVASAPDAAPGCHSPTTSAAVGAGDSQPSSVTESDAFCEAMASCRADVRESAR
jgi:hypothetical protein